jgi:hypothetical protein
MRATGDHITLKGNAEWQYQKDAAARCVRDLFGVKGVTNSIAVLPQVKPIDVRDKIEAAFKRSAEVDARRINVNATDGKVILSGTVRSYTGRHLGSRRWRTISRSFRSGVRCAGRRAERAGVPSIGKDAAH